MRTNRNEIWKAPVEGRPAVQVTRNGGFVAFESPNRLLYYTKTEVSSKLWRCNLDGSGEEEILDSVASRAFAVVEDRICYARLEPRGKHTLRSLDLASRKDMQIATVSHALRVGLSLSPDGRHLIYSRDDREGGDLMLVHNFR